MTPEEGFKIAQERVDGFTGGDLFLNNLNLTELPDMTHLNNVEILYVDHNALTSLKGCPINVLHLYCDCNKLTSLEYSPVCSYVYCTGNNIKNLEHYRSNYFISSDLYYANPILTNHINLLRYYKFNYNDISVWRYYENYFNS